MAFDWPAFLVSQGIEFSERGENVSRGNIVTHCPFCGSSDTGQHLGISLNGRGWGCWRDATHRGKSPLKLVMAITGLSMSQAMAIIGTDKQMLGDAFTFGDKINGLMGMTEEAGEAKSGELKFLKEMRPLVDRGQGRMFVNYLIDRRRYKARDIEALAHRYQLHYAMKGKFRWRLVIPVFMEQGLVNWTARAIAEAKVRYRTLSADPIKAAEDELPPALVSIDRCLFDYDRLLRGGDTLVVQEGPMDAMRTSWLAYDMRMDLRATCFFGKNMSGFQADLLGTIAGRYRRKILMLDPDAMMDMVRLMGGMGHMGFEKVPVPAGVDDPADFDKSHMRDLFA